MAPVRLVPAALAALVLGVLVGVGPPAHAAGEEYVALGDSYSSGTGTREYLDDGTECLRSVYAYPSLIAAARDDTLDFRACSGARIPDVRSNQLGSLGAGTDYVTVSIGGNDAGFTDVITECALPAWASDCAGAVGGAQEFVAGSLPAELDSIYSEIRERAPAAEVVVVGYPRLFMGEDCNAATFFSPADEALLNDTADLLGEVSAAASARAGFEYADPVPGFLGHAVCDDVEWLNGLASPIVESYHPNRAGHADGYTPLVGGLTGGSVSLTPELVAAALAQGDELVARQRRYAEIDARIEPERVEVPTRAELERLAERRGVDFERWLATTPER